MRFSKMISGWLLDAYPLRDKMVLWIKQNNKTIRITDNWAHSIYVASDEKLLLKSIINGEISDHNDSVVSPIKYYEFISKYEKITSTERSKVLQLTLADSTKAAQLASRIDRKFSFGQVRFYNVDVLPAQSYFYEHDIFPLANCKVHANNNSNGKVHWNLQDDVWSTDYKLPKFKKIHLRVYPKLEEGQIPKFSDRISRIEIHNYNNNETVEINHSSEVDVLNDLVKEVAKIDPDFIITDDGDSFTFPYLIERSQVNNLELNLSRENLSLLKPEREGTSYFSYGRIYFKPTTIKLMGRIHIDTNNSFVLNEAGLEGLYEVARVCRMPLHTASRASIGKCMSSLQFYNATRNDILIPWKPTLAEHPKTLEELLIADRGGMIFDPDVGVHEQVAEFDYVSLYPNIMYRNNISAETILCNCCNQSQPNTSERKVPELNYHICQIRKGIVPTSLQVLLGKRSMYKRLLATTTDNKLRQIYDARRTALKWILVTSFGYLGFNNAKFGRIDAHIAVCAIDRKILLKTMNIAEEHGYHLLHGIVDSIWVKKSSGTADHYKLKEDIERKLGFELSFEGVYKWVVFVPSKRDLVSPVANRYFGVFENGSIKIRGLEARRHDTPIYFSKVQQLILNMMAEGNTVNEVVQMMPKVKEAFYTCLQLLKDGKVPLEELVFTKRTSKDFGDYQSRNTVENNALSQLANKGKLMKAGQILKYIITGYPTSNKKLRSVPIELVSSKTKYNAKGYSELLCETVNSITGPFGLEVTPTPIVKIS
jgi:DNA polymerase-2